MSNHRTKYFKLLTVCIVLIQIFTVTTAGALTALQPTPQMAQAAAADLGLGHFLGESFAGLAWGAQQIFGAPKTALAQAPTASADIQFSTGGGSFADDVTVLPGTTILVRINYDNTGDLNGSAASITSALPAGFSLVPGSTVNCLNPTATELVCNTDAGQGGAIDEGAVWAGSNLTIAPTAGLYGEPVGTTSGVLATGRKAYFNLHHCHYQESTEAGFTDDLIHYWAPNASGPNGTWADTNISNTQDTSVRCATPSGSYVFAGPPVVTNFELLGKRYLNWHHCHYQEINNQPAIGDDLVFYGANPTWTGTNTSNTADASATCTNAFAATYTQVGQVVHNLDLLNNRYLNLHYCPYVDTSQGVVDDAYYFLGSPNDPSITTNTSLTPDVSAACNSAPPGPGDWHQAGGAVNPMDYLDTARGKGFIAFQMVATSTPGAYPQAADLSGGNFSTANDSGTITVQATAVVPSVDKKFYGGTTPSGDDNVTVPQGATFTERIFFDNTGNIAGTATSVTAAVPAGFALVAGSTKVCLTPSDTEQVCNTDAGQGGAINEGAVWSGQNLTISPSAGLFGESTGATSGVLEMGKKRYLNLHECKFSSPSDQFWMINPNAGGFFAGTNVANTADASPNCGGGTGSYPLGNLASVANLDLLGRRYLNLHECNYSSGTEQFWSNSPTAGPYAAGTNTSNTVDATASCQAGSEYPHTGLAAVAELDLLNNRYLNLHECKYSGPTDQFWSSNPKLGSFAAGTNTANTQDASPNCANGTGSYPFTNSAVVASLDLLDATRGKGYVEFQLVANAAVGSYVQTAGISGAEFSALSDNGTITVVASAPVPSVDKQFSNDGTTFANSITVPQGATITERIYYNNSGNEAGVGSTISATIPTGFSLVAGSTKNCLNPTAGETVCNTDAGQGGAINEGAVWSGQTLNIAPSAGLYGASSSDTSGRLETGRKRYFNLHECQYLNPSAEDFFTNVGYGPYVAGTNVSNTQDGLANCGGGDATWTNNAKSVRPLDLLGRRYLNLHECQYNTAVPNDVFFTLGGGDGGPTYATGTNTSNTEDTDATCGPGNAGGSPQTKVWRPLDLQDKRYLNLVECQYLNSSINDNFFTNVGYSPYDTSTSATSSQPSGPSCTGGGSGWINNVALWTVMDLLDTTRGRGYIEFQIVAGTPGVYTQNASISGSNFSQANDNGQITVVATTIDPVTGDDLINAAEAGAVTVTGATAPGASVTVEISDGATTVQQTVVADANGNYSATLDTSGLADGPLTVTATPEISPGNFGDPATATVTKDTVAPASAPTITSPAPGDETNDTTPTFTGAGAEPGSTVTVYDGATPICTATADASGNWSCTPATPLSEGDHTITATATDPAGNEGPASAPQTLTVDTTPPASAPAITSPAPGEETNDTTPTFTGAGAEPDSTVTVYDGATPICTTTADASGNWQCTPATPLSEGDHTITATATDLAGNEGPASTPQTLTVDTTAPAAPAITSPAPGSFTGDTTPTFTGTAEPGSDVTVYDGATPICTATADANGNWQCTPATPLSEGPHTITATATDDAGNTSPASTPLTLTVATTDSDNDGVPDLVENAQGTNPNDPTSYQDIDQDGVPDYVEQQDGTDPNDPNSYKDTDNGGTPDYVETILYPNMGLPATNPNDPSDDNRDTDVDGVPDYQEVIDGTNPNDPTSYKDTDQDLVPDYVEQQDGTNPNDPNSYKDTDGDRVPDYVENKDGTNPNDKTDYKDTDQDLVPDYVENRDGTNPNDPNSFKDTDNGGAPDYVETVLWSPQGNITDPADDLRDTDQDGVPDLQELKDGTNPNDKNSFKDIDLDGVPDYVELQDGTDPNDPTSYKDTDLDRVPDYVENQKGTNPNDATDYPDGDGDLVPDYVEEKFDNTNPGDPNDFKDTDNGGVPDYVEVTLYPNMGLPPGNPNDPSDDQRDTDGGGVSDYEEIQLGTDPLDQLDDSPDTDDDGVPDAIELQQGTDPNDKTSYLDTDQDGVPDWVEGKDGTNPNDPNSYKDSDKDGVPDYVETKIDGTNPADINDYKDSDGDKVPDYIENRDGADPNDPTDYKDTDRDLVPDYIEKRDGTDPNDPNSFNDTDSGGVPDYVETVLYPNVGLPPRDPNDPSDDDRDTDGGTVSDYEELKRGSDPLDPTDDILNPGTLVVLAPTANGSTNDTTPTFIGTGTPGDTITVSENGAVLCTAVVDANGDWQCTPASPLSEGPHTVTVTATDPAGNPTGSVLHPFGINTGKVSTPVLLNPKPAELVNSATPTFSGLADPGSVVTISEGGRPLCTAIADENGRWECESTVPLPDGVTTVTMTATDPDGNDSIPGVRSFVIDATPPAPPVITGPVDGSTIAESTPTFTGAAEPGSLVTVRDENGAVLCTAEANALGQWQCTSTVPLDEGEHVITVTATDDAGNISPPATVNLTVDYEFAALNRHVWLPIVSDRPRGEFEP